MMKHRSSGVTTPDRSHKNLSLVITLIAASLFSACFHQQSAEASPPGPNLASKSSAPAPAVSAPLPTFNSGRAWRYLRETIAFGARPIGSANHKKLEAYITSHLKGDQVEDDAFMADTPVGKLPVRNIIAKYPGTHDGIIVIA